MTLRRYVSMKPSRGTVIPASVRAEVYARDQGCVAVRAGFTDHVCFGGRELDHVRVGGIGLKSPSESWNLVTLCAIAHREKTLNGKVWRPALLAYIERRDQ